MTDNPIPPTGRSQRLIPPIGRLSGLVGRRGSLWSNPAFLRIWVANAIDDFGTQIGALAVPLTAAITLGAGPFEMGMLAAAQRLPYFAFGLIAGVLVDRLQRQPLMVFVNWARAALLGLIPLAAVAGMLRIELLYALVVLTGVCGVVFDVAYTSWLPSLVERSDLHDANGKMEATYASAQAAGPGISGVLVGLIGAPFAIAVDACTFLVSAVLIRGIRTPRANDPNEDGHESPQGGVASGFRVVLTAIAEGVHVVWRDAYVRATTSCSALVSLFGFAFLAVYVLFMTDVLRLSPAAIGLILAAGGIGAVIGSAMTVRISRMFGFGPTMIWAQIVFAIMGITVPIAVLVPSIAVPMLALSEFAQYGALAVYNIGMLSLRQARMPAAVLGRATASVRTAVSGAAFLGSVFGGVLGAWIGLGETLVVGVAGMALACLLVIFSPLRSLENLSDA